MPDKLLRLDHTEPIVQSFSDEPEMTQHAAHMSLALSATAYHMETSQWQQAGWQDFSYQIDHTLMTGRRVNASQNSGMQGKISRLLTGMARKRIQNSNAFHQIYGTLRQKEKSDTCKSLVMAHPLSDGRILIAIGFMGTGKRLFDWISNLRLSRKEYMHQGFLQLTEEFESHADDIRFSHTAQQLGIERLTLHMILEECRHENSRFLIWMSGHSQGSAVMQVFCARLLQSGVMKKYLLGYGFASPTVIHNGFPEAFSHYPLHHLICSDDLTPRVGAKHHLGTCHLMHMTDELRNSCYPALLQDPFFPQMLSLINRIADTREALLFSIALLRVLSHISDQDARLIISGLTEISIPGRVMDWLGDSVSRMILYLSRKLSHAYRNITGEHGVPLHALRRYEARIHALIRMTGARYFANLLAKMLSAPHHLQGKDDHPSAYERMINQDFEHLRIMDHIPLKWPVLPHLNSAPRRLPVRKRYTTLSALRDTRKQKTLL